MNNLRVAVIDFETTGLDDDAQAVEMAIVLMNIGAGNQKLVYCQKFQPTKEIHPRASQIHGIYKEDLIDCPSFQDEWPKIEEFLSGVAISSYNLPFDLKILRNESPNLVKLEGICGLVLARCLNPSIKKVSWGNKLTDSCKRYQIKIKNAHSAGDDAMAAAKLLDVQFNRLCLGDLEFSYYWDFLAWQRMEAIEQERSRSWERVLKGQKIFDMPWTVGL